MILKSTLKDIFRISMNQFLLVILLVFSFKSQSQCPEGDLNFTTQAQIDQFIISYPNCVNFLGSINIMNTDVVMLNGFNNLETIGGSLNILDNLNLTNINGFNNLETI